MVEVAAYLIATEAMTNVARHARAHHCLLRLIVAGDLTIEVSDDGVGIPADPRRASDCPPWPNAPPSSAGTASSAAPTTGGTVVLAHLPLVAA